MLKLDNEKINEMIKKAINLEVKPICYFINGKRFDTWEYEIFCGDDVIFIRNLFYFEWYRYDIEEIKQFSFYYDCNI